MTSTLCNYSIPYIATPNLTLSLPAVITYTIECPTQLSLDTRATLYIMSDAPGERIRFGVSNDVHADLVQERQSSPDLKLYAYAVIPQRADFHHNLFRSFLQRRCFARNTTEWHRSWFINVTVKQAVTLLEHYSKYIIGAVFVDLAS